VKRNIDAEMKRIGAKGVDVTYDPAKAGAMAVSRISRGAPIVPSSIVLCSKCGQKCWFGIDSEWALAGKKLPFVCVPCLGRAQ
jgi:hypothetical protein